MFDVGKSVARWSLGVLAAVIFGVCSVTLAQARHPVAVTNLRPDPPRAPTVVTISVFVIDILSINDTKQIMTCDMVIRMQWQDPHLVAGTDDTSAQSRTLALGDVWSPQIHLANSTSIQRSAPDTVTVTPDGTVTYRQRFLGQVGVTLDLVEFPLDQDTLVLELTSFDYTPEELEIIIDESLSGQANQLSIKGWTIGSMSSKTRTLSISPQHKNLASAVYELPAKRELGYYIWKVIIPLSFIVFMSWAVFFIDPANLGTQIGIATSSVLTLIAFYLHLGSLLPQVSFLTRLDTFIFSSTVLVFLAFGEAIYTSIMARIGQENRAQSIDNWCRGLFPAMFVITSIYSFWI